MGWIFMVSNGPKSSEIVCQNHRIKGEGDTLLIFVRGGGGNKLKSRKNKNQQFYPIQIKKQAQSQNCHLKSQKIRLAEIFLALNSI